MLLRYIRNRSLGIDNPKVLQKAQETRRTFNLTLSSEKELKPVHVGGINSLSLECQEGRYLLSGGQDRSVSIYDICTPPSGELQTCKTVFRARGSHEHAHEFSLSHVEWFPNDTGIFTTSGMDGVLKIWDANDGRVAESFADFEQIYSHAMSPVSSSHNLIGVGAKRPDVILVDMRAGSFSHTLQYHRDSVLSVCWSTIEDTIIASASKDRSVCLWDVRSSATPLLQLDQHNGQETGVMSTTITAHNAPVNGVKFTPDGLNLLTTGADSRMRLWDAMTGTNCNVNYPGVVNTAFKQVTLGISTRSSIPLVYHPCEKDVLVYRLKDGQPVTTLRGHYSNVHCCEFHPFLQELYTSSNDNEILVWTPHRQKMETVDELRDAQEILGDAWSDDDDDPGDVANDNAT